MQQKDVCFLITFVVACSCPLWIYVISHSILISILVPYPFIFPWLVGFYRPLRNIILGNDILFTLYLRLSFIPHCIIRRWILHYLYYLPNQLSKKCIYVHRKSKRSEVIFKSQLPIKKKDQERWVCIGDTHELHKWINVDDINLDVLVHTGNFTMHRNDEASSFHVIKDFNDKVGKLNIELAFCTGGNHDHFLEKIGEEKVNEIMDNVFFQVHGTVPVRNYNMFLSSAHEKSLEKTQNSCFREVINNDWPSKGSVDILVTHGAVPKMADQIQPKIHIFGHDPNSYGVRMRGSILEICCPSVDAFYAPIQLPIVFDYDKAFDDRIKGKKSSRKKA